MTRVERCSLADAEWVVVGGVVVERCSLRRFNSRDVEFQARFPIWLSAKGLRFR